MRGDEVKRLKDTGAQNVGFSRIVYRMITKVNNEVTECSGIENNTSALRLTATMSRDYVR